MQKTNINELLFLERVISENYELPIFIIFMNTDILFINILGKFNTCNLFVESSF